MAKAVITTKSGATITLAETDELDFTVIKQEDEERGATLRRNKFNSKVAGLFALATDEEGNFLTPYTPITDYLDGFDGDNYVYVRGEDVSSVSIQD